GLRIRDQIVPAAVAADGILLHNVVGGRPGCRRRQPAADRKEQQPKEPVSSTGPDSGSALQPLSMLPNDPCAHRIPSFRRRRVRGPSPLLLATQFSAECRDSFRLEALEVGKKQLPEMGTVTPRRGEGRVARGKRSAAPGWEANDTPPRRGGRKSGGDAAF